MFVSYKPSLSLDVYRNTDRCVCGLSSVGTYHNGKNNGYCFECAKKREEFVKDHIGNIFIGKEKSLEYSILSVIENIRLSFFEERINYMINNFFAKQQDNNYNRLNEPYDNNIFIRDVTYEVIDMLKNFICSVNENISNNSSNKINNIFKKYVEQLNKLLIFERDRVDELNAILGGYTYTKRKR